jgi:hypothetical protein
VSATLERWELEALAERRLPKTPRRRLSMVPVDPSSVVALVGALRGAFPPGSVFLLEESGVQPRRLLLGTADPPPVDLAELVARLGPCMPGCAGLSLLRLSSEEATGLRRAGIAPLP